MQCVPKIFPQHIFGLVEPKFQHFGTLKILRAILTDDDSSKSKILFDRHTIVTTVSVCFQDKHRKYFGVQFHVATKTSCLQHLKVKVQCFSAVLLFIATNGCVA